MAVVGVGNLLRGDDAAGVAVIRALMALAPPSGDPRLKAPPLLIDAGAAPENITGDLRHSQPCLVLFIDAADMGCPPGHIHLIPWSQIDGFSASTHTLPLSLLARFLRHDLLCDVALLAIQPASTTFGAALHPAVESAVETVTAQLAALLFPTNPPPT